MAISNSNISKQSTRTPPLPACTSEAPSSFGVLRCACYLWPECPFYAIKHQEYTLTLSPQTIVNLDSSIKDKLGFMSNGDGVFIKISESNLSTYLAQTRAPNKQQIENCDEFNPDNCQKPTINLSTNKKGIAKTSSLDFLPVWDKFHKVLGYSPYDTSISPTIDLAMAIKDVGDSSELSFFAGNQMWIEIGSIYQEKVRSYIDYGKPLDLSGSAQGGIPTLKSRVQDFFAAKWNYKTYVGSPDLVIKALDAQRTAGYRPPYEGETPPPSASVILPEDFQYEPQSQSSQEQQEDKDYFYKMPAIIGIDGISDPLDLVSDLGATAAQGAQDVMNGLGAVPLSNTSGAQGYSVADINPGLHWGVKKHIPLVPNQGFSLHFVHLSPQPYKVANSSHRYKMLKKFSWLDPLQNNGVNRCIELATENTEELEAIREANRVNFDFANQQYILLRFPPDVESVQNTAKTRNLYLLICEKMPPILFRDSGYQVDCTTGAALYTVSVPTPGGDNEIIWAGSDVPSNEQEINGVVSGNQNQVAEIAKKLTYVSGFFELARCDFISSSSLLNQPDLKIHFRIHSGKLVIQFVGAGVDNQHWVITNSVLEPEDQTSTQVATANTNVNLKSKNIPFNFLEGPLQLYGGGRKIAFGYSPLKFAPQVTIPFPPQNFQGAPNKSLSPTDIHILLSDSTNPYLPTKWFTNFAAKYVDFASEKDPYEDDRKECSDAPPASKIAVERTTVVTTKIRPENLMPSSETELRIIKPKNFIKQSGSSEINNFLTFSLQMTSGSLMLPNLKTGVTQPWPYADTPVIRTIRLLLPSQGVAWRQKNIDLSNYVTAFSDEWSESDFQKITHSGSISFLIPQSKIDNSANDNKIRNILLGLVDKTFYLRVCLWWDRYDQVGANSIYKSSLAPAGTQNFPEAESVGKGQLDYNVMFTGFCSGGSVNVENNKQIMTCVLNDYSKVLQDSLFFNSPYFDRMTDVFAVREILNMVKFRICQTAPAYLVDQCCIDKSAKTNLRVDGLTNIRVSKYILPGSYNQMEEPAHKPADNTPLWGAIETFALQASKICYFDALGRFRYMDMPFDSLLFEQRTSNKTTKEAEYKRVYAEAKKYGLYCASFKDIQDTAGIPLHLLIDDYKYERIVADIKNRILIISTSPNGELFVAGDINYDSFYNTDKEGFIGYERIFVQMDGIFGSEATVKQMVSHYTKMYIPPLKVSFKARGYRCMTCMTPILFMGLGAKAPQPLIVSKVANEIDVAGNRWIQNFDCIWLFEGRGVDFGETREMQVNFQGVIDAPKNISPPKQA